jgi:hypothetical protein
MRVKPLLRLVVGTDEEEDASVLRSVGNLHDQTVGVRQVELLDVGQSGLTVLGSRQRNRAGQICFGHCRPDDGGDLLVGPPKGTQASGIASNPAN